MRKKVNFPMEIMKILSFLDIQAHQECIVKCASIDS